MKYETSTILVKNKPDWPYKYRGYCSYCKKLSNRHEERDGYDEYYYWFDCDCEDAKKELRDREIAEYEEELVKLKKKYNITP